MELRTAVDVVLVETLILQVAQEARQSSSCHGQLAARSRSVQVRLPWDQYQCILEKLQTDEAIVHNARSRPVPDLSGGPERRDVHAGGGNGARALGRNVIHRITRRILNREAVEVLPGYECIGVHLTGSAAEGDHRRGVRPADPASPVAAHSGRGTFVGLDGKKGGAESLRRG